MSASTGEQRGDLDHSRRYSVPVVPLIVHQTISPAQWLWRGGRGDSNPAFTSPELIERREDYRLDWPRRLAANWLDCVEWAPMEADSLDVWFQSQSRGRGFKSRRAPKQNQAKTSGWRLRPPAPCARLCTNRVRRQPRFSQRQPLDPIDRSAAHRRKQGVASSGLLRGQGGGRDAPERGQPHERIDRVGPAALPRGGIHPTEVCR